MSYRKISVDSVVYEYVIGVTHLKVKGLEPVQIAEIGQVWDVIKEDGGLEKKLYTCTPSNVREYIISQVKE